MPNRINNLNAENTIREILSPPGALSNLSEISRSSLRAIALTLAGLGIACGNTADSNTDCDNGITSDGNGADCDSANPDAGYAPSPDLNADNGTNGNSGTTSYNECPKDILVPPVNLEFNDCFKFGCFDDVVSQISIEESIQMRQHAIDEGRRVIKVEGNNSAITVGNENILMTSVGGCTVVVAFAHGRDGQMVRGMAHISINGPVPGDFPLDYRSSEEGSWVIMSGLKRKMIAEGGTEGTMIYYIFNGQPEGSSVDYLKNAFKRHYGENDCGIFKFGLISPKDNAGMINPGIDVFSIIDSDGKPKIVYPIVPGKE